VAAGLLERDGDRIRFTHPLLASSVYVEALPEQRRQMHRRLADVVEDPEARARHLALAATGRDAEAASALEAAALRASARGAPDTASELLELAIELTPERLRSDRDRRRLEAADSYFLAGSIVEGVALLRQLAEELPAGKSRADVLVRLAWRVPRLQETIVLAEQASVESAGDEALLSRTHVVLGTGWPVRGIDATLRHGRRALRHAEASGERRLVVEALARLAHWSLWAGKNPSRFLDRALVLEREDQSQSGRNEPRLPLQLGPQMTLALWRMYQGRLQESRTAFDTVLAEATTRGDEPACVAVEGRLADVALRAGDWPRAEMHVAAALELAEQIGHEHDGGLTLYFKAFLDVHTGCVKAARETAEAAMDAARLANARNTLEMTNAVIGALEISLGNESKALAHLKPLLAWLDETNLGVAMHPLVPYAIEALIAAGELQEARALTARFELEARRLDGPWMSMIGARNRGLIALAAGDILAASDALAAAASYEPPGEWPFEQARTLLALGRLRRRERQKGGARRCFEAALALFESLPAPLWAEVAREELARLGLQRSSTREMTESERRVAELAGTGLTTREVAAKLFMSPKTVEAHLARAYRKLGIRSRAELGARLATQLPDHSRRS
jgi:DNA-binding CsgD family transcriptional regulator